MSKKSNENILARYKELQPKNGSRLTPRKGYYLIKKVFYNDRYVAYPLAETLWKESLEDTFNGEHIFTIGLTALQLTAPSPEDFSPETLAGKQIHISSLIDDVTQFQGLTVPITRCTWEICNSRAVIENKQPSFFDTIPNDKNLGDFLQDFPGDELPPDGGDAPDADTN